MVILQIQRFHNSRKSNRSFLKEGAAFPKKATSCVMLKCAWKINVRGITKFCAVN